jgi:N12 class adenine-specific DNA methylase
MDSGEDAFSTITYDSRNFGKLEEETKEKPVDVVESNLHQLDTSKITKDSAIEESLKTFKKFTLDASLVVHEKFAQTCSDPALTLFLYTKYQSTMEECEILHNMISPEEKPFDHKYIA